MEYYYLNNENRKALAKARFDRAKELIEEADELLENNHYKSANNRAFYSAEKALKAALSAKGKDAVSHNGVIKTFNMEFIHTPNDFFDRSDMSAIQTIEQVRSASDYDDFYVTSKAECEEQVQKAKELVTKVEKYLEFEGIV